MTNSFFKVTPSCQIPNLAEIYFKVFGEKRAGQYVEVGAYDGLRWSNTSCLMRLGWKGLLFEPHPDLATKCRNNCMTYPNITVKEEAVGDHCGTVPLYLSTCGTLSVTDMNMVDVFRTLSWTRKAFPTTTPPPFVDCVMTTLDAALAKIGWEPPLDVLVVDTEGTEVDVLKGFDCDKWKPTLAIIEACEKCVDEGLRRRFPEKDMYFNNYGYKKIYVDHINTIYAAEHVKWTSPV